MSALKECPFCGPKTELVVSENLQGEDRRVLCTKCGAEAPEEVWNTRPASAEKKSEHEFETPADEFRVRWETAGYSGWVMEFRARGGDWRDTDQDGIAAEIAKLAGLTPPANEKGEG